MSSGRGDDLLSSWVSIHALIPRVEHGTGGDDLSVVATDFFFGSAGGTPASAPVTGLDVVVTLGTVSARGAAAAIVTGLDVAATLGAVGAVGAARATCTGFSVPVTLGNVTAQGDAPAVDYGPALSRRRYRLTPRRGRAVVSPLPPVVVRLGRVTARGSARGASRALPPVAIALGACAVPWSGNPTDEEMLDHLLALT